jgi:hypothetical protein
VVLKEAFLIHKSGLLIIHKRWGKVSGIDDDVLAGILTAIQGFVKYSFGGEDKDSDLKSLKFGEESILVQHGELLHLAVLCTGRDFDVLRMQMGRTVKCIEEAYAHVLDNWNGELNAFSGVENIIESLLSPSILSIKPEIEGDMTCKPKVEKPEVEVVQDDEKPILDTVPRDSYDLLSKLMQKGFTGICVTEKHPDDVIKDYELEGARFIWLQGNDSETSFHPGNLGRIKEAILEFANDTSVVLLDNLKLLVRNTNLSKAMLFINDLENVTKNTGTKMIILVDVDTFEERKLILLGWKSFSQIVRVDSQG